MDLPTTDESRSGPTKIARNGLISSLFRVALYGAAVLILAGIVAPYISVGRYGAEIQKSLETSLGRKLTMGQVHFTLFAGPGFSIDNVTIAEDPLYGIEPCAYVPTLEVRVRLDKLLLAGQIQIAELRLVDPTLNLVKRKDGTWNVVDVVDRLSRRGAHAWSFLPAVEISGARLNFKLSDRKTNLYVQDSDIAAYPESSGKMRIRFTGSPSRSDRTGRGFGTFHGDANWYLKPAGPEANQLEADVNLDRSNMSELVTLVQGYDVGVHGSISSHMVISGPATALHVKGDLYLEDIHRWDLLPSSGEEWHVRYRGLVDLQKDLVEFETLATEAKPSPVTLHGRVNNFLTAPSWSILANLQGAPAENLLPLARRMGLGFPQDLNAKGLVSGAVGYSSRLGWNGGIALESVVATLPNVGPLRAPSTTLSISNDRIHIEPSTVESAAGSSLQVSGDYVPSTRGLTVNLKAQAAPVENLSATINSWFGAPTFLKALTSGLVSGQLRYINLPPDEPVWSGDFQLLRATLNAPGLAQPVRNLTARVALARGQMDVPRFSAVVGGEPVSGEYHYNPVSVRTERLRLQLSHVDAADLEKALAPTLGPQDFFSRFRFGRRSPPSWLLARNMDGEIVMNGLSLADTQIGNLKAHFLWSGTSVQVTSLQARLPEGLVQTQGLINLANIRPRYSLNGQIVGIRWKGGYLNVRGQLSTSGLGQELLRNLEASGQFTGSGITASRDVSFSNISGTYAMNFDSGWPRVHLTNVQAEQDDEEWQGTGESDESGGLALDLANGFRQMRVVSTLDPSPVTNAPMVTTLGRPAH